MHTSHMFSARVYREVHVHATQQQQWDSSKGLLLQTFEGATHKKLGGRRSSPLILLVQFCWNALSAVHPLTVLSCLDRSVTFWNDTERAAHNLETKQTLK